VTPRDIQTFSIAFEDPSFDESRWSRMVASYLGTHHREQTFSVQSLLDALPRVTSLLDEPFADASILPTYLLSQFTRQHVTVALGGDGGDELFAGYETFRADAVAQYWRAMPATLRAAVSAGVAKLPVSTSNFSLDFVAKRFVSGADAAPEFRHVRWMSAFLPNTPNDPLRRSIRAEIPDGDVFGVMARPYLECKDHRHVQRLSNAYLRTYMAEDILTKVDRASMMTSLEVRSPFLDPEFISLVTRMPPELKLHGLEAKYALKQAVKNDLPHEILYRKKKGFGIPVAAWLKGPLSGELDRVLDGARLEDAGIFEPSVVRRLVTEHREGRHDHRKALWTLLMFENWRERFHATL
jgi:asparagine synthase (glutamine-hydrolysing)